jgi:hypothetical protein
MGKELEPIKFIEMGQTAKHAYLKRAMALEPRALHLVAWEPWVTPGGAIHFAFLLLPQ